jgi:hypothetical protein
VLVTPLGRGVCKSFPWLGRIVDLLLFSLRLSPGFRLREVHWDRYSNRCFRIPYWQAFQNQRQRQTYNRRVLRIRHGQRSLHYRSRGAQASEASWVGTALELELEVSYRPAATIHDVPSRHRTTRIQSGRHQMESARRIPSQRRYCKQEIYTYFWRLGNLSLFCS